MAENVKHRVIPRIGSDDYMFELTFTVDGVKAERGEGGEYGEYFWLRQLKEAVKQVEDEVLAAIGRKARERMEVE